MLQTSGVQLFGGNTTCIHVIFIETGVQAQTALNLSSSEWPFYLWQDRLQILVVGITDGLEILLRDTFGIRKRPKVMTLLQN